MRRLLLPVTNVSTKTSTKFSNHLLFLLMKEFT